MLQLDSSEPSRQSYAPSQSLLFGMQSPLMQVASCEAQADGGCHNDGRPDDHKATIYLFVFDKINVGQNF